MENELYATSTEHWAALLDDLMLYGCEAHTSEEFIAHAKTFPNFKAFWWQNQDAGYFEDMVQNQDEDPMWHNAHVDLYCALQPLYEGRPNESKELAELFRSVVSMEGYVAFVKQHGGMDLMKK